MKRIINYVAIVFLCFSLAANEKAIIEGLSYMAVLPSEIGLDLSSFRGDSYSMKLCDYILENPQKSEFQTEELVKYIRGFSISELYKYADRMETDKKKNKKTDWKNISMNPTVWRMDFLYDTMMGDSDYYSMAEEFLKNTDPLKIDEKRFINILEATDYLLSVDETEMRRTAEDLKKTVEGSAKVIIGTMNDDTFFVSRENVLIIDFGGDDCYIALNDYSLACGENGISGIIDFHGDDNYIGKSFDMGCGINGVGFIDDREGNDAYSSVYCSMGSGFGGIGFILDRGGNDTYTGNGYCQGFGFTKGVGFIYDINGNDSYIVRNGIEDSREAGYHAHLSQGFGFGMRDIASGGVGMILDNSGDDLYTGEYFVQGSSYWHSLGILYDNSGNDVYKSRRYSQGAGTHFTTGLLFDREGDDLYHSWGVSQGCGHDFSFGMLTDYKGNDIYYSNWLSQGAGNANGVGLLIDYEGNDSYKTVKTDSQGWGNPLRETFSYGMLFDMQGEDSFNKINQKTEVKTKMGVLIDKD